MISITRILSGQLCACLVLAAGITPAHAKKADKKATPADLRSQYISRLEANDRPAAVHTLGSIWSPGGDLTDMSADYKARKVNDTLVILASVQTTASQSGNVNSQRTVQASSAITGLAGEINTKGLNPLFNANSSSALKGAGASDSSSTFQTSLTGQVIAVLPSGNLVVEAQRKIYMNNQHEEVTIRGVVRPNDIGPANTVASSALGNLEIEMKGKGIISDSTRPLNPITRAIMWLVGF